MTPKIHMTPDQLALVKKILSAHLNTETKCWVFGSRAKGDIKPFSDLDIAIDAEGAQLSIAVLAALSFDFEESDLPFKVDLIDWNSIDQTFKDNIQKDLILF